jgi:hypothetical protein
MDKTTVGNALTLQQLFHVAFRLVSIEQKRILTETSVQDSNHGDS